MVTGILGKKLGMSQIFDEAGKKIPLTIIEAGPCVVQAIKKVGKHGYNAIQLGYDDVKEKNVNKPQREYLKKNGLSTKRYVREIRCDEVSEDIKVGDIITSSIFQKGDYLDILGTSKGKGFQGGIKRCNWSGGKETHGSMSHRSPGSIGASSYPSRVHKGHPMPGQMGNAKVTVQNLEVVEVDLEKDIVAIKGALPGAIGSYVIMRFAGKKTIAPRIEPEIVEEEVVEAPENAVDNNESNEGKEGNEE
jgi:large subunit ribosomal protein L3